MTLSDLPADLLPFLHELLYLKLKHKIRFPDGLYVSCGGERFHVTDGLQIVQFREGSSYLICVEAGRLQLWEGGNLIEEQVIDPALKERILQDV